MPKDASEPTLQDEIMVTTTLGIVALHTLLGGLAFPVALQALEAETAAL